MSDRVSKSKLRLLLLNKKGTIVVVTIDFNRNRVFSYIIKSRISSVPHSTTDCPPDVPDTQGPEREEATTEGPSTHLDRRSLGLQLVLGGRPKGRRAGAEGTTPLRVHSRS